MVTRRWLEEKLEAAYQDKKHFGKIVAQILAEAEKHCGRPCQAVGLVNHAIQIRCENERLAFADLIEESESSRQSGEEYAKIVAQLALLCGVPQEDAVCARA